MRLPPGVHGPRSDGRFYGTVELPAQGGKRRRRTVYGRTPRETADRLRVLQLQVVEGALPVGKAATVRAWLDHWLERIAGPSLRPKTVEAYRWSIGLAVQHIGAVPLDRLTPEHLEALYASLSASLSPASVLHTHRVLHKAFRVAEQRRRIGRNPADLVDAPSVPHREATALSADEARRVLTLAPVRWQLGLALGLRQGEALGLLWSSVDLDAARLRVAWQLQRVGGRFVLTEPKSSRSRRTLPIPAPLVEALREHRREQLELRLGLGADWLGWDGGDLVFARPDGRPLDRWADRRDWLTLLDRAGVRRVRVHDGRHTTATLLLEQGVDVRIVQDVLGHTSPTMSRHYQHVTERVAAGALDGLAATVLPDSRFDSPTVSRTDARGRPDRPVSRSNRPR